MSKQPNDISLRGASGYGSSHVMTGRKPIMGLGVSDIQHNINVNDTDDEADHDSKESEDNRVKVSRVFKIEINEIRKMIRSILNDKRKLS